MIQSLLNTELINILKSLLAPGAIVAQTHPFMFVLFATTTSDPCCLFGHYIIYYITIIVM